MHISRENNICTNKGWVNNQEGEKIKAEKKQALYAVTTMEDSNLMTQETTSATERTL